MQTGFHSIQVCNLFELVLSRFDPTERLVHQVPRPADLLRVDHHRHGHPGLHRLGLSGGGRGPQAEEQPVQGTHKQCFCYK